MVEEIIDVPATKDEPAPDVALDGIACKACLTSKVAIKDSTSGDVSDSRPFKPNSACVGAFGITGVAVVALSNRVVVNVGVGVG